MAGKKSTIDQLTLNEKKALAHWYGTDTYKALEKLARAEVAALGEDALAATDIEHLRRLQGRAAWAVDFFRLLKLIYTQNNQDG